MKTCPTLLVVLCFALLAQDKPQTEHQNHKCVFQIRYDRVIQQEGPVVVLWGHAKITTQMLTISADEIELNKDTGEMEPRGNVHIRATPRFWILE